MALVRNPEYVMYGSVDRTETKLSSAEAEFNNRSMIARSNIKEETLTNVDARKVDLRKEISFEEQMTEAPAEYIVVTLIVASEGKLKLPRKMRSVEDLLGACKALGGVGEDAVQGVEVIWAPQAKGTTLTEAEMLLDNPDLIRL